ncbi:MAG: nucleotidyltransferase domain-containing protein [Flavobacteriaceae bacterium]|nr:nucleotidyltransferase domain-containing protein [Flavobacteriaceae bacterium]MCY4215981.1 nucleotidyltransferase domain-containing protein [Flavobacteriaceae bacterium]MCY4253231.1 nucleotidyltransferase domain-containing protein [Flavobacteriaceae bacterium]
MLTKKQQEIIIEKFKPLNPTRIGVFGSYARNEENKRSDIDLLYSTTSDVSFYDRMRLKFELTKLLEKKIDLGPFDAIKDSVKDSILKDAVTFYKLENAKSRTE